MTTQIPELRKLCVSNRFILYVFLMVSLVLTSTELMTAQTGCACNNQVNLGLNNIPGGKTVITQQMILEDPYVCSNKFVRLKHNAKTIAGPSTYVEVDCGLLGQYLKAEILDLDHNVLCWGWVFIEDKWDPSIYVEDVTINCDQDNEPTTIDIYGNPPGWGYARADDNCSVDNITYRDLYTNIDDCGRGSVTRMWRAFDGSGSSKTTVQIITRVDPTAPVFTFPADVTFNCEDLIDTDPANTGMPTASDNCSQLSIRHEDRSFVTCLGACEKILRTWEILDWCNYNAKDGSGIYIKEQELKIRDLENPTFTAPSDQQFGMAHQDCNADISLPPPTDIADNCDVSPDWSVTLKDDDNNVIAGTGSNGQNFRNLSKGKYTARYVVEDCCGNNSFASIVVIVVDNVNPTAACDNGTNLTLTNTPNGSGWGQICKASFDDGSSDNCELADIKIRIPGVTAWSDCITVTCAELGLNTLELRATDVAGNENICWADLLVEDKGNPTIACPENVRIPCDADLTDPAVSGIPVTDDNCIVSSVLFSDNDDDISSCGTGVVLRTWTVMDQSGNSAQCLQLITLFDDTPVAITTPPDVTLDCEGFENTNPGLGLTGNIDIQVDCEQFNISAPSDDRVVSTTNDDETITRSWFFENLCDGSLDTFRQTISLLDCSTSLTGNVIQINGHVAAPNSSNWQDGRAILALDNELIQAPLIGREFNFYNLPKGTPANLSFQAEADPLEGISTYDIVLIRQHLLGHKKIEDPYKLLAADVNMSGNISAADILELRSLILGKIATLSSTPALTFIALNVLDDQDPMQTMSTSYDLDLLTDVSGIDFRGIKMGDVNGNEFNPFTSNPVNRSYVQEATLILEENALDHNRGELSINIKHQEALSGFQFALRFDPNEHHFEGITYTHSRLSDANFNIERAKEGIILVSFDEGLELADNETDKLFGLVFTASNNVKVSQNIRFDDNVLQAEWYDHALNIYKLRLDTQKGIENGVEEERPLQVWQNRPNPFKDKTSIAFDLAQKTLVHLEILTQDGKMIYNKSGYYEAGRNEVELDRNSFNGSGIYFYRIRTDNAIVSKKMVLIE